MMKRSEIVSEAVRNAVHRQLFLSIAVGLVFVAVTCMTVLMVTWSHQLRTVEDQRGRFIIEITAASDQGIDPWRCESLGNRKGVLAAGGIYESAGSNVENPLTYREIPSILASPGAMRVWGLDSPQGAVVGSSLAAVSPELVTAPHAVTEDHLQVRIAGVAPSSIPVEALNSHLIVPAFLDAPLSVCWVRYVAPDRESVWAASSAAMGLTPVIISDFFPVTPDSLTSEALWDRYISALPSVLAGFVAIALAGVTMVWRRREVAVMRIAGVSARDTFTVVSLEHIIPLLVMLPGGFMWGCLAATAATGQGPSVDAYRAATMFLLGSALLYIAGCSLLAGILSRNNPLAALKD